MLVVSLLATSTPAAPQVLKGLAFEWQTAASLGLRSRGWLAGLGSIFSAQKRPGPGTQEKHSEREARVARVEIAPGDLEAHVGQPLTFSASAYDAHGAPVSGVRYKWRARDVRRNRAVHMGRDGTFEASREGEFRISVEGAHRSAEVTVRVAKSPLGADAENAPVSVRTVSTRDVPASSALKNKGRSRSRRGARVGRAARVSVDDSPRFIKASFTPTGRAAALLIPENNWDDGNFWSADDPGNTVGDPPGTPLDDGAGSGNFQLTAPLLSLPGRGLNLSLALNYNSRVWNKATSQMTFDIDHGWPAPGWSLGFGKMMDIGDGSAMIVEADGTRRGFTGTVTTQPNGSKKFNGRTVDGSFIDYTAETGCTNCGQFSGKVYNAKVLTANGTVITYGAMSGGAVYPTKITDANGNYLVITYRNGAGPHIHKVTDTLNREVTFDYDAANMLTSITAQPFGTGVPRTLVRLQYQTKTLGYNFPGMTVRVPGPEVTVLRAIYYPGTGTGYWFGEADSYSSYGMLANVREQRGMSFNEPETVVAGVTTSHRAYSYPMDASQPQSDAPTYETLTETWEGMTADPAVTHYLVQLNATPRRVEVTAPNNTKSVQLSYNLSHLAANDPQKYRDGLLYEDQLYDAGGTLLSSSFVEWGQGSTVYQSARPQRTETTNHEIGQKVGTEFTYSTTSPFNQMTVVRAYGYGYQFGGTNTLLRETRTEYENSTNYVGQHTSSNGELIYTGRHIFNLTKSVEVYAGDGATRVSHTLIAYDGATLANAPDVVAHSDSHDPYTTAQVPNGRCCMWAFDELGKYCEEFCLVSAFVPATNYRGNITQVKSYADAATLNEATAVVETRTYDITGNVRTASNSCCDRTQLNYTVDTQYAYSSSQSRGSSDPNSPVRSESQATYDFNTGLVLSTTVAGRTSAYTYHAETLRPKDDILPTGARTTREYDDFALKVTGTTTLSSGGAVASKSVTHLNGAGMVIREEAWAGGEAWDAVETKYDQLGRAVQQSRPYRVGSEQPQWSTNTFDALGRVEKTEAPDGSFTEVFYNKAARPSAALPGSPAGQTTKVVDAWGRERWGRADAQGRLVELVEPDPSGDGTVASNGLRTTYDYDTQGNLVQVTQGEQQRKFRFDSLGRLTHQKLAETLATLDGAGAYVGVGGAGAEWSDVFAYDQRSNLVSRTEARGVTTSFNYNNDPLDRLQSIAYAVGAQHDTSSTIAAAATVAYEYETGSDITRLRKADTAGVSEEVYTYDADGRVINQTVTLDSRPSKPLVTDYEYDELGRLKSMTYPQQYPSTTRKQVTHSYDAASRLDGLKVGGVDYASQFDYNASSQTKSLKVGPGGANQVTEKYEYDAATGLLSGQRAFRGADENENKLLHLSYDYLRPGTTTGRTGQLTKLTNHLDARKGRAYTYDTLGRLKQAAGGNPTTSPLWTQAYHYDRYGNRTGVTASGNTFAGLEAPAEPSAKMPNVEIASATSPQPPAFLLEKGGRAVTDGPDKQPLYGATARGATKTTGAVALAAPTALSVTEASGAGVSVSWTAPAGAVGHYEVERSLSAAGPYEFKGNASATTFDDSSVTVGTVYLYRVRAVDGAGVRSAYSNFALGAAITFTDATLVSGTTSIKAQHFYELRQTVNKVRAVAGLSAAVWTDPDLAAAPLVRAIHVQELRDRLDEALEALDIPTSPFTDPVLATGANGTPVKRIHVEQLRQRASSGSSTSPGESSSTPVPTDGLASVSYDETTNRIDSPGWAYDAAGNQTRVADANGDWRRMEYDAAGRLVHVKTDGGAVLASYTYGDSNFRLMTQEGSQRTYYTWVGGSVVSEFVETDGTASAASPQWSKNYVHLGGRLLATQTPSGAGERVEYHHPDRLGTRVVTNNIDATSFEQAALPFGTALAGESTGGTARRFTSYERSGVTGLDYANNRHYDARQGRFTQVDPIGMRSVRHDNPQTLNLYAYCANDPVNNLDPSGLGFLSFFKKLFGWIGKALKWIAIAVTVAVFVLAVIVQPASGTFLFKVLGKLTWLLSKIGMGAKFASGGLLAAEGGAQAASLGLSVLQAAGALGAIANHLRSDKKRCDVSQRALGVGAALLMMHGSDKIASEDEASYECGMFDTCASMGEKIRDLTKSVGIRRRELDPDTESYKGHAHVWARQKNILNKCIQKFKEKGCGDGDMPPGSPLRDAISEAGAKAPALRGLGDFRRRNGLILPGVLICTMAPAFCGTILVPTVPKGVPVPVPVPAH